MGLSVAGLVPNMENRRFFIRTEAVGSSEPSKYSHAIERRHFPGASKLDMFRTSDISIVKRYRGFVQQQLPIQAVSPLHLSFSVSCSDAKCGLLERGYGWFCNMCK